MRGVADTSLAGRTLGLIGFSAAAREVAARAREAGMTVCLYDPLTVPDDPDLEALGIERMALYKLLSSAHAISLHLRLTDEARNLIDWETLSDMRPDAVIVNASRSGLVDEGAVDAAVRAGLIGGALLDLTGDDEPSLAAEPLVGVSARPASRAEARIGRMIAERVRHSLEARGRAA